MHRPLLLLIGFLAGVMSLRAAQGFDWVDGDGFRWANLPVSGEGRTGFTQMGEAGRGIGFTNHLAEARSLTNQIYLNGSGVAAGDVDGDGRCDLYFCGLDGPNALYRNLGDWRFSDITTTSGVACPDQASTGAVLADIDGDGDLDLLVSGIGRGVRLFLNDGRGTFHEGTEQAGLGGGTGSMSLALADGDGDGWLDLYVANYRTSTMRDEPDKKFRVATANNRFELLTVDGRSVNAPELRGRFTVSRADGVLEHGEADVLYRNVQGRFSPVGWTSGAFLDEDGQPVQTPYDWGLSVLFRDLNGDQAPDLYVCNDFQSEDRIWINDGHGRYRAAPRLAFRQTSLFSMGVDVADIDRDGHDDMFVADMLSREHVRRQVQVSDRTRTGLPHGVIDNRPQHPRNTLFWNRGDGTYAEIAQLSGVEASEWSWCPVFLDVDLDGFEDLLNTTGHARDAQNADVARRIELLKRQQAPSWSAQMELRKMFPPLDTPNLAFRNRRDRTFEEAGEAWGFDSTRISHGMALADLDQDGDLDVVVNCLNDAPLLYRNESAAPRLAVRLRGKTPNTRGIGARITVRGGPVPAQSQEIISGGRYLSGDDAMRMFAAGSLTNELTIEVIWRNGQRSRVAHARANRLYEVDEVASLPAAPPTQRPPTPWFADVSALIAHTHRDDPFDDFSRQPLLPRKLSQLGPGIGWFDLDTNGWDDLMISSGSGGALAICLNDGKGGFSRPAGAVGAPTATDQTAVLGWHPAPGKTGLLVGLSHYESGQTNGDAVAQAMWGSPTAIPGLGGAAASTGPLALADIDGDGDLDLFVGGRVIPGRYPEAASSLIFRNENGDLRMDPAWSSPLKNIGCVSGAIWTDLTGDGLPELVLACDGGPIRVFRNQNGALKDDTAALGFAPLTGWWNSVAAGDFDGDGRLDLMAGNWGRNTKYQRHRARPVHLYYGDSNEDGITETIEAYADAALNKTVPALDLESLATVFPDLRERYPTFEAFSTAGVSEFLGSRFERMRDQQLTTFESMVFLNRGDHFEARALPFEAQLAPVFGLAVGDMDGDGQEDVYLSQNFFGVPPDSSRHDGGRGVLLKGDGRGGFTAVPGSESGLQVYGEGRAAALCDYDQDGHLDLAIGQNANKTMLYHNVGTIPGLTVHLQGSPQNPDGIGAVVRLVYPEGRMGPAHEVHAGGGYWSQDSCRTVLGRKVDLEGIQVKWPGGAVTEIPVPNSSRKIIVRAPGASRP